MNDERVQDEWMMEQCLDLAREAETEGETAVGALVAREGDVIARGRERTRGHGDPTAHAEVVAVHRAIEALGTTDLSACTLVTTVEPCAMCAYVLRETGIGRVVWGADAGHVGGARGRHPVLTDADMEPWTDPPETAAGVMSAACRGLLLS